MAMRTIKVKIDRKESDTLPWDVLEDRLDVLWKEKKQEFWTEEIARRNNE